MDATAWRGVDVAGDGGDIDAICDGGFDLSGDVDAFGNVDVNVIGN